MDRIIFIILILVILVPAIIKWIKKIIREESKRKELPLAVLKDKLEFALICGWDKAVFRLQAWKEGPYVEFNKTMQKREPSRIQMILDEDVCGLDIFRKAVFALKNKGIPYYGQKSDDNNARTIVVECGRNFDLAYACAYTILTEGFGIPPDGHCLQKEIGDFSPRGFGFGHINEISFYGVVIKVDELMSVVENLKNSQDKDAFVLFGWKARKLPKLKKEFYGDEKTNFVLEYPVFNRREKNVISKLEENEVALNKAEHTVSSHLLKNPDESPTVNWLKNRALSREEPTYLISLGTDTKTVTEKLKQILRDSGHDYGERFGSPKTIKYRLSEFVTADWKPKDGADSNADESSSGNSANLDKDQTSDNQDYREPTA